MLSFTRVPPVVKRVVPVIVLIALLWYFTHSGKEYTDRVVTKMRDKKTVFLETFMENDIGPPINGSGLARICSQKPRNTALVFSCDTAKDGFASVRQHQLQCIRLGIESGASKIILSNIVKRKDRDFVVLNRRASAPSNGVSLDYMLDYQHAHDVLSTHCPQIDLHSNLGELHDVPSLLTPVDLTITDDELNGDHVLEDLEQFELGLWEQIAVASPKESRHYPLRVRLLNSTSYFPVYADGAETAREFGSLIRARPDARRLAGSALFALSQRYNIDIDPRSNPSDKHDFVGVHLRVEKDSKDDFPNYFTQAGAAIDYISRADSKVVFLGTGGSGADIKNFKARAADFGVTVVTKHDLLEGDDAMDLWRMTYDQKALVDYEILKRAGTMVGQTWSKFSWNLAMARSAAYGAESAPDVPVPGGLFSWDDGFTTLVGTLKGNRGAAVQATWP